MSNKEAHSPLAARVTAKLMWITGIWVASTEKEEKIFAILREILALNIFAMSWTIIYEIYVCDSSFYSITQVASNAMPVFVVTIKTWSLLRNRQRILALIRFTETHFWNARLDKIDADEVKGIDKVNVCWIFVLVCNTQISNACLMTYYALYDDLEFVNLYVWLRMFSVSELWLIVRTVDELTTHSKAIGDAMYSSDWGVIFGKLEKKLKFALTTMVIRSIETCSMKAGFFAVSSETFTSTLSVVHSGICFCCFDNFLCILSMHVGGQFKILQNKLQTVLSEKSSKEKSAGLYKEFKECVQYHHLLLSYVEKLEYVFCVPLMIQLLVSSIVLCVSGFQLSLVNGVLMKRLLFLNYFLGGVIQIFLITLNCNDIMEQSGAIGTAIYSCNWERNVYNHFYQFRKDMMIVMVRAKRPCYISAAKFFPISLESFTKVLSATASYYTLLRTMEMDVIEQ
ncbi:PREDICTED: uncharacterized protein LOC108577627 [Habropoda laboriosa]|uniref:uncharacterized protein LOC108577627 n=1 Tax=Habropoda laboriosa TaxID=597456 RepID=UPI00083CA9F9|nr:PREDICTED: uncharacterized protein LOC108577627 [Habropoda laboriosa]